MDGWMDWLIYVNKGIYERAQIHEQMVTAYLRCACLKATGLHMLK